MTAIAYVVSADVVEGRPEARADVWEVSLQLETLRAGCAAAGITLTPVVWDEPFDLDAFDAVIVGCTWDYPRKLSAFLGALETFASARPVLNPPRVIGWNSDKGYLKALAARGAPVIPTRWEAAASAEAIAAAFEAFETDEIVVKPVVGAGAWRQARLKRGEPLPPPEALPPAAAMIQPFLPAIPEEGEYSFMYFGDVFSHGLVKKPKAGDYRVQALFGGRESVYGPSAQERALAEACLKAARLETGVEGFLYARVDMARGLDGALALMELELIEPYYYPVQGPETGARFAAALEALLVRASV